MGRFLAGEWVNDLPDAKQVETMIEAEKIRNSNEIASKLSILKSEVEETISALEVRVDKVEEKPKTLEG